MRSGLDGSALMVAVVFVVVLSGCSGQTPDATVPQGVEPTTGGPAGHADGTMGEGTGVDLVETPVLVGSDASGGRWEIIPTKVTTSPSDEAGWQEVRVAFLLENRTGRYERPHIPLVDTPEVRTDAGFAYPAELLTWSRLGESRAQEVFYAGIVPPGFRVADMLTFNPNMFGFAPHWSKSDYQFRAQIAASAVPIELVIPGYGAIKLTNPQASLALPRADESTPVLRAGDDFVIPEQARITVTAFRRDAAWTGDGVNVDRIFVDLTLQNLNAGYDTDPNIEAFAIGDDGYITTSPDDSSCSPSVFWGRFKMGPGQTIQASLCVEVASTSRDVFLVLGGGAPQLYSTGTTPTVDRGAAAEAPVASVPAATASNTPDLSPPAALAVSYPVSAEEVPIGENEPRIWIDELSETNWTMDMGTIPGNMVTETEFTIRNIGNALLVIEEVSVSCSCMAGRIVKTGLSPGESSQFRVSYDPRVNSEQGKVVQGHVRIRSSDPKARLIDVTIQANVTE